MRVIEVDRFGGPEVLTLREVPDPVPRAGEVLIDVQAADTLWLETMIRRGQGGDAFPVRPPYRPGGGVAGTTPGGRTVVARTGQQGGYVERVALAEQDLVEVPDGVSARTAAALLHDGTTALRLWDLTSAGPRDRVLVTAAAGGLGALLVQLALRSGARVVAAARGEAKLAHLRRLGADVVVDYSEPGWTSGVGAIDLLLDGAGGEYGRAATDLVAEGGQISAHGTPAGSFTEVDPGGRDLTVTGIQDVQLSPDQFTHHLRQALEAAATGQIEPLIGQTFPLERAADAHATIENRTAIGKTLLTVDS